MVGIRELEGTQAKYQGREEEGQRWLIKSAHLVYPTTQDRTLVPHRW